MAIAVHTKLVALLGTPLGQSFTTVMQNAAFEAAGLDYCYFPVEVGKADLEDVVRGLRCMNCAGFAVTKPHKLEIMKYIDTLDEACRRIGACNTVVARDSVLVGYNTDGAGCVLSLIREAGVDVAAARFLCIGAGGTARAVCYALAKRNAGGIAIVSRSDSCKRLAAELNGDFTRIAEAARTAEADRVHGFAQSADVILNLSGVGMYPNLEETILDKASLRPGQLCFDATYNPEKTRFLREAEEAGCAILNGLGMVVNQGALQFELWTGRSAPVDVMWEAVRQLNRRSGDGAWC